MESGLGFTSIDDGGVFAYGMKKRGRKTAHRKGNIEKYTHRPDATAFGGGGDGVVSMCACTKFTLSSQIIVLCNVSNRKNKRYLNLYILHVAKQCNHILLPQFDARQCKDRLMCTVCTSLLASAMMHLCIYSHSSLIFQNPTNKGVGATPKFEIEHLASG